MVDILLAPERSRDSASGCQHTIQHALAFSQQDSLQVPGHSQCAPASCVCIWRAVTNLDTFKTCIFTLCKRHCNRFAVSSMQCSQVKHSLTHWGRVTHICVSKLTIIGPDNGLSPGRRQAIIWTNAGILLIGPCGTNTNFSEILIGIHKFSFKKMHLKMSSAKRRLCCLGPNVLKLHDLTVPHGKRLGSLLRPVRLVRVNTWQKPVCRGGCMAVMRHDKTADAHLWSHYAGNHWMSKYIHWKVEGEINYRKLKWWIRWRLGMDKQFHPKQFWSSGHVITPHAI